MDVARREDEFNAILDDVEALCRMLETSAAWGPLTRAEALKKDLVSFMNEWNE
jgi:hypothetical protein